ncbi:hypothetical protein [Arenibaculum sp.]|uniref:hypothetical protein n=1 Tax=Arenibaculum sp. TaxID=2865862 RepID=UPI002E14243B|nr:hypothetical protein [Arenibaculum sp.]
MDNLGKWIIGGVMGVLALLGLYLASHAVDQVFYWFGLGLTLFALLFAFGLMKRAFDEADAKRAEDLEHRAD